MTNTEIASASKVMLGTTEAVAMYIGSIKMWPVGSGQQEHDYSQDYFTIESLEDSNEIKMQRSGSPNNPILSYSLDDGETWTTATISGTKSFGTINTEQKIIFKGNNTRLASAWDAYNYFTATKQFKVYGNIMSLLNGDNFITNSEFQNTNTQFAGLFRTDYIVDASNLILPALTLYVGSYNGMFRGATNLSHGPKELPATSLQQDSCSSMFEGCINLEEAPIIHAITFNGTGSMMRMFCMSRTSKLTTPKLTKGPVLPAKALGQTAYKEMFKGNGNIVEVTCLATSGFGNCSDWLTNCSETGTFYKNSGVTVGTNGWIRTTSQIPVNWTVQDYVEDSIKGQISEYVQNGLIFHLDGIDKGQGSDWTDLIGGIQFTVNGSGCYSTSNSWYFPGNNSNYLISADNAWGNFGGSSNYTVEVCYYNQSQNNGKSFVFRCGKDTNYPLYYCEGNRITWLQYGYTYEDAGVTTNSKYTVSINNDQGFVNKTLINKSSSTDYWDTIDDYMRIGGAASGGAANSPMNGDIYSIRIYNRKLTREEQLQNMSVDNIRFNLGL